MTHDAHPDRRIRRTRGAIFEAFRALVLSRRYDEIRVGDIIAGADVGRSTFYEHFNGKDDVLLSSIEPLFEVLADIPSGRAAQEDIHFVAAHFWDQRAFARIIFRGELNEKLARKLADMIEARGETSASAKTRLFAVGQAASLLGVIRAWLSGEISMSSEEFTDQLIACDGAR